MCTSPLLHRKMSLQKRCEVAATGFVAMDLWRLQAAALCEKMRVPTGSTFLAPQTLGNLQGVALATLVICITKKKEMECWKTGSSRLSELAVEQLFGCLRQSSSNAQLSCRGYWAASARHALKTERKLMQEDGKLLGEKPLTDDQCLR